MNLPFITAHASKSQPLLKMRVTAFLAIAAITGLALPSIAQAANPATVSLTVHYQRPESDYTKWNLWLWKNLTTGSDVDVNTNGVEFTSEDSYGKIATVEITGMDKFDDIGIIVRKGSWDAKDVEADRFIKQIPDDGKVEIWLRQGDSQIYYQAPTEPAPVNTAKAQSTIFDSADFIGKYTYLGNDLGNTYSKSSTAFRVWAPTATAVSLLTYEKADSLAASARVTEMKSDVGGTWVTTLPGDNNGVIYTYRVAVDGGINEAVDPYVRATTVNGARGVVIDLSTTNPANWTKTKPAFSGQMTDAIIYELHVRDFERG